MISGEELIIVTNFSAAAWSDMSAAELESVS